jgi:phosphatidylglycerophosphate synthase
VLALLAGAVADCVDGELARLRHQGSKLGEWLDSLADDISTGCFLVGLSFGQTWLPFGLNPLWFGLGCATVFLLMSIYMYHTLSKYVGVLDTAQFPYFFMTSRTAPDPDAPVGFADIVGLIFRRDFLIALALVFAVLNAPWLSLLIIGAGLCVTAVAVLLTAIIRPPHRHARTGQA